MHFFIEHGKLTQQQAVDQYGPDGTNPTTKFNVTSAFQLSNVAKAFACQDSIMIVQQSTVDSSLVNVILKPIEGLKIPFSAVKYFVYRGLLKTSFISGSAVKPQNTTDQSEFIRRFWKDWNNYTVDINDPDIDDPTPQSFGYDNSLSGTLDIEKIYDNSQSEARALLVKEGEWFGDFGNGFKIGFEVILAMEDFVLDLNYLRAEKFQIEVVGLSGLELEAKRNWILSYVDPAAFFGLHYDSGIKVTEDSGTSNKLTSNKKKDELYALILNKFLTKNRVYLDIRSEHGYAYNFYQNYKGPIGDPDFGDDLLIGDDSSFSSAGVYQENGWPIKFFESIQTTSENHNQMFIALRTDDNTDPILFSENKFKRSGTRFLSGTELFGVDWTEPIEFEIPNTGSGSTRSNVAYYIKLQYFRGEYNPASPATVLKNENYFDLTFCPIDLPRIGDTNYLLQQVVNPHTNFVRGLLPDIPNAFGHVATNGARWDQDRIVFYSQAVFNFRDTGIFFQPIPNWGLLWGFNLAGSVNKASFLARDILVSSTNIQEILAPTVYGKIKLLDVTNYNDFPNAFGSIICLGITQTEFSSLKGILGFSEEHHRYIYIEEISGSPLNDKDGKQFRKFRLKVQGIDNNGNRIISSPSTDIYVYSNTGEIFASKNFSDQEINQLRLVYQRNYEEAVGYENMELSTHLSYEDFFIEKDSGMKTEVDGFITALANIANDENAYQTIKTLVEDNARDIWDQAISSVQASSNANPDDRPLYWARNKMAVAIKSHPYFANQFLFSDIVPGSELKKILDIFEEKSRNYSGIDFSSNNSAFTVAYQQNPDLKKILVSGFDPFLLNPSSGNIEQSNPAGANALSIHNSILYDNSNPIGIIQTAIFPVRFADFDDGVIESFFSKYIDGGHPQYTAVDYIFTISQGGPFQFWVDRFASKYRGTGKDNLGRLGDGQEIDIDGDQFYATQLPENKIVPNINTGEFKVLFNNNFKYSYGSSDVIFECQDFDRNRTTHAVISANNFTEGTFKIENIDHPLHSFWLTSPSFNSNVGADWKYGPVPSGLTESSTPKKSQIKAKDGSGGDYLSNEIFYRVSRLRKDFNPLLQTGHLHIPLVQGSQSLVNYFSIFSVPVEVAFNPNKTKSIITKITEIIKNSIIIFFLIFSFSSSLAQPGEICVVEFEVFDGDKMIVPYDTSYLIDPQPDLDSCVCFAYKNDSRKYTLEFSIKKRATNEVMKIKSRGCTNKGALFRNEIHEFYH